MTTSGNLPEEAKGLNWGAFLLGPIWGVFNGVWLSLLVFLVGPLMSFVLLFKGNEWAWKGKSWNSVEEFKASQKKWATGGVVILVVWLVLAGGAFVFAISQGSSSGSTPPAASESASAPTSAPEAPAPAPDPAAAPSEEE